MDIKIPTSNQMNMVEQLIYRQKSLKLLWGICYSENMAPVIKLVKEIMEREGTKALPTVITMAKEMEKADKVVGTLSECALLVAAVEIMQEK